MEFNVKIKILKLMSNDITIKFRTLLKTLDITSNTYVVLLN